MPKSESNIIPLPGVARPFAEPDAHMVIHPNGEPIGVHLQLANARIQSQGLAGSEIVPLGRMSPGSDRAITLELAAEYWSEKGYHNTANKIREYAALPVVQVGRGAMVLTPPDQFEADKPGTFSSAAKLAQELPQVPTSLKVVQFLELFDKSLARSDFSVEQRHNIIRLLLENRLGEGGSPATATDTQADGAGGTLQQKS